MNTFRDMADLRGTEPMHGYNSVTCPRSTSAKQQAGINHPSNFTKALTFLALCDVKFKTGNSNCKYEGGSNLI